MPDPSLWVDVMDWMQAMERRIPKAWPEELPPEHQSKTTAFWESACRHEMTTRQSLSAKLRLLANGGGPAAMSPLEWWLVRRRMEWASQAILAQATSGKAPPQGTPLAVVVNWAMVDSWESDGCIGMWHHFERGGLPHPDNPEGFSPTREG